MFTLRSLAKSASRILGALVLAINMAGGTFALGLYATVGAGVVGSVFSTPAIAGTNGRNATVIQFPGGSFELNNRGEWLEFGSGSNAVRYVFRETHRDDWSVYGHDASRNMNIQMDLHRKKIRLEWPGHPMQDQYNITSASNRLNGRRASYVAMDGGSFTLEGQTWVERDQSGQVTYRFRESHRDMWSVYARDNSRQMDMQIDLHRRVIRLAWPGQAIFDWKNIRDAR